MNTNKIAIASGAAPPAIIPSILAFLGGTLVRSCTKTSDSQSVVIKRDLNLQSIGITLGDLSNPFFVAMGQGAEQETKKISQNSKQYLIYWRIGDEKNSDRN